MTPNKPVLILAGGFGTRLRSLVPDVPKPLAPVCGRPFLEYLVEDLVLSGARNLVFLLHYQSSVIEKTILELRNNKAFESATLASIVEEEPLGTGGSIMNAVNTLGIDESFFVLNADTWLSRGFEEFAVSTPNSIAAVRVGDAARYGGLILAGNKVEAFLEKDAATGPRLINAGMYHLTPNIFNQISPTDRFSMEADVFPKLAERGDLFALEIKSSFIDIGIPEDYLRFCSWIESGRNIEL